MEDYEFLVPGRAVSVHERDRTVYREFQTRVFVEGARVWPGFLPFEGSHAHLTIVYLCRKENRIDVDNVIKPVMGALEMLYYPNDEMVSDVDAHRRFLDEKLDTARLPELLRPQGDERQECVYVRIQDTRPTEDLPWVGQ